MSPTPPLIHILAPRIHRTAGRVTLVRAATRAALSQVQVPQPIELTIRLSDDDELRILNCDYRGVDTPTDVLSFGGEEFQDGLHLRGGVHLDPCHLGDIIISMDRCAAQAHEFGHSIDDELALLVVHGVLHLCGFDHMNRARKKIMWQAQERAFTLLGRANPLKPGQFHR